MNRAFAIVMTALGAVALTLGTATGVGMVRSATSAGPLSEASTPPPAATAPLATLPELPSLDGLPDPATLTGSAPSTTEVAPATNGVRIEQVSAVTISAARAKRSVLKQVPGTVLSVTRTKHGGYPAYAVTVRRADGSTATGYVDRSSGVIFDWTQTAAPAAPSTSSTTSGSHASGDDHESENEHESEREHESEHGDD